MVVEEEISHIHTEDAKSGKYIKRCDTNTSSTYDLKVNGTVRKRSQLDRCLHALNYDDVLVVWKLDRLGRSLPHLLASSKT